MSYPRKSELIIKDVYSDVMSKVTRKIHKYRSMSLNADINILKSVIITTKQNIKKK